MSCWRMSHWISFYSLSCFHKLISSMQMCCCTNLLWLQYNPYIRYHNPPVCSEIIETGKAKEVWLFLWHAVCFHCGWGLFACCLILYVWCFAGMWICMNNHHATEESSSIGSHCCSTVPFQWVFYSNNFTTDIHTNMQDKSHWVKPLVFFGHFWSKNVFCFLF